MCVKMVQQPCIVIMLLSHIYIFDCCLAVMQHVHYAVAIAFTNDYIVFATFCCACCLFVLQHTHHRFLHLLMTVIMLQTHLFFHILMVVMLHLIFCILINWLNPNIMSLLHWIKHAAAAAAVSATQVVSYRFIVNNYSMCWAFVFW